MRASEKERKICAQVRKRDTPTPVKTKRNAERKTEKDIHIEFLF